MAPFGRSSVPLGGCILLCIRFRAARPCHSPRRAFSDCLSRSLFSIRASHLSATRHLRSLSASGSSPSTMAQAPIPPVSDQGAAERRTKTCLWKWCQSRRTSNHVYQGSAKVDQTSPAQKATREPSAIYACPRNCLRGAPAIRRAQTLVRSRRW